jgi:transcriptional regulator with XRE-family HTH domain
MDARQHSSSSHVGEHMKQARQARRLSQMELSLRVGVSQRHLSFIETGRARPSREMLLALLDALELPLAQRNELLMKAGYAPHYPATSLDSPDMQPVREALLQLLSAHDPSPAMVLDRQWNLVLVNRGMLALWRTLSGSDALGLAYESGTPLNLLDLMLDPDGLQRLLVNREELLEHLHQRVWREVPHEPALQPRLEAFESRGHGARHRRGTAQATMAPPSPVLTAHFQVPCSDRQLAFFSMFTTFGTPHDITIASLKVEHLFPADEATRDFVRGWLGAAGG